MCIVLFAAWQSSVISLLPRPARADSGAGTEDAPPGSAAALFKTGLRDLDEKNTAKACPALRRSYGLDARPIVLFHLARCEEQAGNVATAAAHYGRYIDGFNKLSPEEQESQAPHEEQAAVRREALLQVAPTLTLRLPDDAPDGVKVTHTSRDGLETTLPLHVPLPVDPGQVVIFVRAPGHRQAELRILVKQGEHRTVDLPALIADGGQAPSSRAQTPVEPVPAYLPRLGGDSNGQRIAAYVAGSVGLAAISVSAVAGAYTWGQKKIIETECLGTICNSRGEEAQNTAAAFGMVSTVTFAVGALATTLGVILYVTAPSGPKLSAVPSSVVARPSGMEVTWQW